MDTVSIALVGYGGIAEFHAHALSAIEGVRPKTLVGRRADPAEAFALKMGFEGWSTDYDAAIADPEIDNIHTLGHELFLLPVYLLKEIGGKAF